MGGMSVKNKVLPIELEPFAQKIKHLSMTEIKRCGIYFLYREKALLYIGKSLNYRARVSEHARTKDFDEAYILPLNVDNKRLLKIESMLIDFFCPPLNIKGGYKKKHDGVLNLRDVLHEISNSVINGETIFAYPDELFGLYNSFISRKSQDVLKLMQKAKDHVIKDCYELFKKKLSLDRIIKEIRFDEICVALSLNEASEITGMRRKFIDEWVNHCYFIQHHRTRQSVFYFPLKNLLELKLEGFDKEMTSYLKKKRYSPDEFVRQPDMKLIA
jgi:hypothetical protein